MTSHGWAKGLAILAAVAGLAGSACTPRYTTRFQEAESPILSSECEVRLFDRAPDRPFVIVGELEAENPARLATDEASFLKSLRPRICRHGGNAVIAQRDDQGRYLHGTVIRLR